MSLKSLYESFLKAPNATFLATDAALHYVTTLTTINKAEAIEKHLTSQHRLVVRKKGEKILNTVEGPESLCMDVEITLEFVTGGGAYLPGLDDNFLTDKVVTLPMIHVVQFDSGKIQSIRIHWEQASLLKGLNVIGASGRNWPIRDGKDQARLIARASVASKTTSNGHSRRNSVKEKSTAVKDAPSPMTPSARSESPTKKHISDPHSSLALFGGEDVVEQKRTSHTAGIGPRASAKPAPRDYSDLFVGSESDATPTKPKSPRKENMENVPMAPKGGGGKNFQPSRLFDSEGTSQTPSEALYKSRADKYNHFQMGDGVDDPGHSQAILIPSRPKSSKGHESHWDFADFATPDKPRGKVRGQDVRHFGWSDDEGELAGSPGKHPRVAVPRRDAETHFEFQDDGTPKAEKRIAGRPKGSTHNTGLGLYQNNLYDEDGSPADAQKQPLSTVTNTNGVGRKKDFGSQFAMTDNSPSSNGKSGNENRPMAGDRMKAVKMMDATWDTYDQSPEQKVNKPGALRKGTERHWGHGEETVPNANPNSSKAQISAAADKNFWDF